MNISEEKLEAVVPLVIEWIDNYVATHAKSAMPVADFAMPRLSGCFSPALLLNTRVARVPQVTMPPLAEMGLPEFADFERDGYAGVTYRNTFFVAATQGVTESTFFHELVHVIQWDEMGDEEFLMTYATGLARFGYRESPLEKMAYSLQADFDSGEHFRNLEERIRSEVRSLAVAY